MGIFPFLNGLRIYIHAQAIMWLKSSKTLRHCCMNVLFITNTNTWTNWSSAMESSQWCQKWRNPMHSAGWQSLKARCFNKNKMSFHGRTSLIKLIIRTGDYSNHVDKNGIFSRLSGWLWKKDSCSPRLINVVNHKLAKCSNYISKFFVFLQMGKHDQ